MCPFAMTAVDSLSQSSRGYQDFNVKSYYNPSTQVSNLLCMGGTLVLSSLEERDSDTKSDSED